MENMKTKPCPKCGKNVEVENENESWECFFCGKGAYVFKCPKCNIWVVKEYNKGLPPVIECPACFNIIST